MADPIAETVELATNGSLRPFVRSIQGYRYEGFDAGIHRGLPSGDLTFIISLSEPVELVAQPDRRRAPRSFRDWREFAGCSPTAWADEEALPIVAQREVAVIA